MKDKAAIIGMIIVAFGLGIALIVVNNNAHKEQEQAKEQVGSLSNELVSVQGNLQEQQQVNLSLSSNLSATTSSYSNKLTETQASLSATQAGLDKAQAAADAAAAVIVERDKKIAELESQNTELDKQSQDLHASITNLESKITMTQNKLATSEGDREFLLKELRRLQAEKADLERKFNDLATLKEQVSKLRAELSVARRLDWIRRGIYESFQEKGGERLMHQSERPPSSSTPGLNVEVRENGSSSIVLPSNTNTTPEAPSPTGTTK